MSDLDTSESRYVENGDVRIHYTVQGSGPPLILLHGGGPGASGGSNYGRNIPALSQHFTTYAIDFPGWGKSSKNLNSLGARSPFVNGARAVALFMDALSIDTAHLVGNSFGGSAAYYMAMEHPARVDRIVAMGPGGAWLEGVGPTPGIIQLMTYYSGEGPTRAKLTAFLDNLVHDTSVLTDDMIDARFAASNDPQIAANPPLKAPGTAATRFLSVGGPAAEDTPASLPAGLGLAGQGQSPRRRGQIQRDPGSGRGAVRPVRALGAVGTRRQIQRTGHLVPPTPVTSRIYRRAPRAGHGAAAAEPLARRANPGPR
jgi:pimeloyl-ACP methyl ester carboxylesterase